MSEEGFINSQNEHGNDALGTPKRKSQSATSTFMLPNGAGVYYLIFNNTFSLLAFVFRRVPALCSEHLSWMPIPASSESDVPRRLQRRQRAEAKKAKLSGALMPIATRRFITTPLEPANYGPCVPSAGEPSLTMSLTL